ncbi:MAG: PD40 domain-containing protein, partial [Candidatus Aminicenantes bacterium]|nr:PD40 domain-containing protein [Candidatus Aminicenantes bacterium]
MKPKWMVFLTMSFILVILIASSKQGDFPILKGPYLGQKPPGITPKIFEPKIVSTGLDELNSVFSPDGREFYFCGRNFSGAVSIFQMKMEGENWSQPKLLPFASRYGDIDVTMSPDGNRILFSSRRPVPGNVKPKEDYDFWMVKREG